MAYIVYPPKRVLVDSLQDLPAPIGNIINLAADTTYHIIGGLDLGGNRLVCGNNVTLIGDSPNSTNITATLGGGEFLITSNSSIEVVCINFTITGANTNVFNLDGAAVAGSKCIMREVSITNAGIGTVKNYNIFLMYFSLFNANPTGLILDGANGVVILDTIQMVNTVAGSTSITFLPTFSTVTRTRVVTSGFTTVAGATGINISPAVAVGPELFVLGENIFTGAGTRITGMTAADPKAFFTKNTGIANTFISAYYYMSNNAVATPIANTTDFVKVSGTTITVTDKTERFSTPSSNRATYTGTLTRVCKVSALASINAGNNQTLMVRIAKNGITLPESESRVTTSGAGASENFGAMTLIEFNTGDFIEVFVRNSSGVTNIVVTDLSVIIETIQD